MTNAAPTRYSPQRLAALTGLPDPTAIVCPERLERLARAAEHQLETLAPDAPLRLKVAAAEYARLAEWRLEHPEQL